MKILVCGGRDFTDAQYAFGELDEITHDKNTEDVTIIHGAARGADKIADAYAVNRGFAVRAYAVDCLIDGPWPAAGVRRNQRMLNAEHVSECPVDLVVALTGGRGTADMVRRARKASIKVLDLPG